MTLHRICNENLTPIKYSLTQTDRIHLYGHTPILGIRKVGRWFQVKIGKDDNWITVPEDQNITVLPLPEAWRNTSAV